MGRALFLCCALLGWALVGCASEGEEVAADAAVAPDAVLGMMMEEPFLPWPEDAPPVALPNFLPCPSGWVEVDDGDVTTCAPFAAGVPDICGLAEAHFPGEAGCQAVGAACPIGRFADDLPTEGTVIFVDSAAAPGGDGSRATPYQALLDVPWTSLPEGSTVALSKGEFPGTMSIRSGVHLAGACARETVLLGSRSYGLGVVIVFGAGTVAHVRNLSIRDTTEPALRIESGGHLTAIGVVIDGVYQAGTFTSEVGSILSLTDVVIRNTEPDTNGRHGIAIGVQYGGRVIGTRVSIDRNHDVGVFIAAEGSRVTLEDSVISNTLPRALNDIAGRGVGVQDGGHFEATRTLIHGNRELGIFAGRDGSRVVLTDVVVADTLPQGGGADNFGRGLAIQDTAVLEMTRTVVEGSHDAGFSLSGTGTTAIMNDAVVRNTHPEVRTGASGRGINVQDGARITASRVLIADNYNVGLVVNGNSAEAIINDVTILDTHVDAAEGDRGYGMHVQLQARVEARGLAIRSSRTLGIAGIHSTLDLENVVVHRTEAAACTESICNGTPFGYGVATISSAIRMSDFVISDSDTCGVFLAGEVGELDLRRGLVTGASIGACVQIDDYDFGRLTDGVAYIDNERNLEATSLPVPEPVAAARPR